MCPPDVASPSAAEGELLATCTMGGGGGGGGAAGKPGAKKTAARAIGLVATTHERRVQLYEAGAVKGGGGGTGADGRDAQPRL